MLGLHVVLIATDPPVAAGGIVVAGIGIGAMFPLTSALHVKASPLSADSALGQVLAVAAPGQYHHRSRLAKRSPLVWGPASLDLSTRDEPRDARR